MPFRTPPTTRTALFCRLFFILVMVVTAVSVHPQQALAQRQKHLLYLNSYHVGYKWSDEEYQGFLDLLHMGDAEVSLYVEYLDTKRYPDEKRYALLADLLRQKYRDIPIDLVVGTDDAAFLLLKEYGESLFPGIPIFFCGTNYLEESDLRDLPNFYGITERADIESTFAEIIALRPKTRKVYIINDQTITGRKVWPAIEKAMSAYRNTFEFVVWDNLTMSELITRVNSVPGDSVIFYTFFFQDKAGQTFEYDQSMRLIARQSPVPIFGAWDFNLDLGLTGGMLTSGYQQGKAMAELVNSWLDRDPFADTPKLADSPNRFMFDYTQLTRFNIDLRMLPADAIIINRPVTFIQRHLPVLLTAGAFITTLLMVIAALTVNIYRRKRAELELRRSEERFRAIFNNASDGLYQRDGNGRFLMANPALAAMLKYSSPQELLDSVTDIANQLYCSPASPETLTSQLGASDWATGEHGLRCRDGSVIDVIENIHRVHDESGNFLYYEGSIVNITEFKKTQELIAQTEKLVSLGGVAAGIAHEVRSPLASIVQGMQVVRHRLLENSEGNIEAATAAGCTFDQIRNYARTRNLDELLMHIHASGRRAGVIIEDMLSFSKKTIGDFSLEPLDTILDQAVDLAGKDHELRSTCRFDEIVIRREYEEGMVRVNCSASKLLQVFFNIIKNGAEAMAEGNTTAPMLTLRIMRDGHNARIEIEDNGPGMSSEIAQNIFNPFFTTKGRERGTGLGLSVSYFIIRENHHGDLRVSSQPELGATFIIELPIEQTSATSPAISGPGIRVN